MNDDEKNFYYQGKYFEKEEDFILYIKEYCFLKQRLLDEARLKEEEENHLHPPQEPK